MVGSINFVRKEGDHVKKGDEVSSFYFYQWNDTSRKISSNTFINLQLGYFSFGGSTVICVFEKVSI